jgi:hypothetical protein
MRAKPDRADNKAGDYSHGCRRIAMIGALALAGKARFQALRQRQNGGMGSSLQPGSKCPNTRKSEIVVIFLAAIRPMRQLPKGYA